MPYLIDSDWVIDYLDEVPEALVLLRQLFPDGVAISVVTYMEVLQGVERSPDATGARSKFDSFLRGIPVLPFSLAVAERCALLREELRRQGKRVHPRALDLINAATALDYGFTLVTRNREDYEDIPGLVLYP